MDVETAEPKDVRVALAPEQGRIQQPMTTDTSRRQERIDATEKRTSPSAGWRTVYAEMGVPSEGGAETESPPKPREDHTLEEYADEASTQSNDRDDRNDRSRYPTRSVVTSD